MHMTSTSADFCLVCHPYLVAAAIIRVACEQPLDRYSDVI